MHEMILENIDKIYKSHDKTNVHALDKINYSFTNGIYGLTGSNGAGKSTLINILAGIVKPTSGIVRIDGLITDTQSSDYKKMIGFMPQQQWIYENMSCVQFLNYMCGLKGIDRKQRKQMCEDKLKSVNLFEYRNIKISRLSGGMKQRLLFAQAILGNPSIIILDEPTAGVDPEERQKIKRIIKDTLDDKIIIFSTHILDDMDDFSDKIIVLENGKILA